MSNTNTSQPSDLAGWLSYLETLHVKQIDLTLERVQEVFERLNIQFTATVITVAGTNGKGTTSAAIENMALYLKKSVGVYSSPHLLDYKERVRINGVNCTEKELCAAFEKVETVRQQIPLTPFEYGTLAAMCVLEAHNLDVVILEVGLGGRLDAVNVVESDLAVITSIGLDHQEYLGETREEIALEKAGILQRNGKAVIGDMDPPKSLTQQVKKLWVDARWQTQDFGFVYSKNSTWEWHFADHHLEGFIDRSIPRQNLSTALACGVMLDWPIDNTLAQFVCRNASLPGRFQTIATEPLIILDVAHNPDATQYVQQKIEKLHRGNLHLVVGMLADKDIAQSLQPFKEKGACWYVASLPTERSARVETLAEAIGPAEKVKRFDSVSAALEAAKLAAFEDDCILVFGSFYTVAEVLSE